MLAVFERARAAVQVADGAAVVLEEEFFVPDFTGELQPGSERELTPEHFECARPELDEPIGAGLGPVLVLAVKALLVGINEHLDPTIPELSGARRDATRYRWRPSLRPSRR
ncbi:MAG TPA: hypothetical protein VMD56_14325 [Steroidobacteraceae bacterium]|nr:hypothetical protein [Steroidobacteraceae bacterium]